MRIPCPFCGERDASEFTYLGDANRPRPANGDLQPFVEAVYVRDNPAGRHEDLWYHGFGCRSWLRVTRDTRTHEIFAVANSGTYPDFTPENRGTSPNSK